MKLLHTNCDPLSHFLKLFDLVNYATISRMICVCYYRLTYMYHSIFGNFKGIFFLIAKKLINLFTYKICSSLSSLYSEIFYLHYFFMFIVKHLHSILQQDFSYYCTVLKLFNNRYDAVVPPLCNKAYLELNVLSYYIFENICQFLCSKMTL
jgi:hypothetical protein